MKNQFIRGALSLLAIASLAYITTVVMKIHNVIAIPYGKAAIIIILIALIWNIVDLFDRSRWLTENALRNEIKRYKKSNTILNKRSKQLASALFFAKVKLKKMKK